MSDNYRCPWCRQKVSEEGWTCDRECYINWIKENGNQVLPDEQPVPIDWELQPWASQIR